MKLFDLYLFNNDNNKNNINLIVLYNNLKYNMKIKKYIELFKILINFNKILIKSKFVYIRIDIITHANKGFQCQ